MAGDAWTITVDGETAQANICWNTAEKVYGGNKGNVAAHATGVALRD